MFFNCCVGDRLEAVDYEGVWATCVVVDTSEENITVTFPPWPRVHDRMIDTEDEVRHPTTSSEQGRKRKEMLSFKVIAFSVDLFVRD